MIKSLNKEKLFDKAYIVILTVTLVIVFNHYLLNHYHQPSLGQMN